MEDVSKEEYQLWKSNKVTQAFLAVVNGRLQEVALELVSGGSLGEDVAQATALKVGYVRALTQVYNLDYSEDYYADQADRAQGAGTE